MKDKQKQMFQKNDYNWWVCTEHPEYELEFEPYNNLCYVILKYRKEVARVSCFQEAQEWVQSQING